jgi:hypothetical protein
VCAEEEGDLSQRARRSERRAHAEEEIGKLIAESIDDWRRKRDTSTAVCERRRPSLRMTVGC